MNINETTTARADLDINSGDLPVFVPVADIFETPETILIRCDMPGVAESDLEINLENKVLTIMGSQMGQGRDGCDTLAREYETGVYQRSFALSRDLDDSAVKARLRDGVLEIELPKAKEARPRRIPVEA